MNKEDLSLMTQNVLRDLGGTDGPLITIILACFIVSGLFICGKALMSLGERDANVKGALVAFLFGVFLIGFPQILGLLNATIFNNLSGLSIIADDNTAGNASVSAMAQHVISFCVFFIQVIGIWYAGRGFKMHAEVAMSRQRQPEASRSAWTHILFGVCCYNILWVFKILSVTLGGKAPEWYKLIFGHISFLP